MNITAYCKTCKRDYELALEVATGRAVFAQCPYCNRESTVHVKRLTIFYGGIPLSTKQAQNLPHRFARWTPSVQIINKRGSS